MTGRAVIVRGGPSPVDVTDVLDAAKADENVDLIVQMDEARLRIRRRTPEGWTFERYSLETWSAR